MLVQVCLTYSIGLFFKHLLTPWYYKMLHVHIVYFLSQTYDPPHPQEALISSTKNQNLGSGCVHCYCGIIASRPFRNTEHGNSISMYA